jgi:hypothetical protein
VLARALLELFEGVAGLLVLSVAVFCVGYRGRSDTGLLLLFAHGGLGPGEGAEGELGGAECWGVFLLLFIVLVRI